MNIPQDLVSKYTMNGEVKIEEYYFAPYADNTSKTYTLNQINHYKTMVLNKQGAYYPDTDVLLYSAFEHYSIKNKDVIVVGSEQPWYETMALINSGKSCTCLEYNKRICECDEIKYHQYNDFVQLKERKFDVCISVSSIEHSGLGRYGDIVDPDGDIKAMDDIKSLLKPGGLLFLSVPVGEDRVMWNAHRVYGKKRFKVLLAGWEVLQTYGIDNNILTTSANSRATVQPVIVLRSL